MTSHYRWEGALERADERQVVIKTTAGRVAALEARLAALHPYEVPELLVLDAAASASIWGLGQGLRASRGWDWGLGSGARETSRVRTASAGDRTSTAATLRLRTARCRRALAPAPAPSP